jgi:hypothetical protein
MNDDECDGGMSQFFLRIVNYVEHSQGCHGCHTVRGGLALKVTNRPSTTYYFKLPLISPSDSVSFFTFSSLVWCRLELLSLDAEESPLVSSSFPLDNASVGGGVFDFGGAEAGAASGSSGVATGGTTMPVGAEGSATWVAGAADGVSAAAGLGDCPGRARRAALAASVTAFMYISAWLR